MTNTTVSSALAHVADVLGTSEYSEKEVFIIIPNIVLADKAATDKYIQDFDAICKFSLANEPGTKKFCAFQPRSEVDSHQVWALEHFDSESDLAKHRTTVPVRDMLSWLMNTKPNGMHPLPVPVVLQIMGGSLVRPIAKDAQDPFVVITQIEFEPETVSGIEAGVMDFSMEAGQTEDVLIFLPGKTDKEIWTVTAYRTKQGFEDKRLARERFEQDGKDGGIKSWKDNFLHLEVGYLFR